MLKNRPLIAGDGTAFQRYVEINSETKNLEFGLLHLNVNVDVGGAGAHTS